MAPILVILSVAVLLLGAHGRESYDFVCKDVTASRNNYAVCPQGYLATGCACGHACGSWTIQNANGLSRCFCHTGCTVFHPIDWSSARCCKVVTIIPEYTPIGCYLDKRTRDLPLRKDFRTTNSPEECVGFCEDNGKKHAALQNGYACFCGDSYGKYGPLDDSRCQKPCPGDTSRKCGGSWANLVFNVNPQKTKRFELRNKYYRPYYDVGVI